MSTSNKNGEVGHTMRLVKVGRANINISNKFRHSEIVLLLPASNSNTPFTPEPAVNQQLTCEFWLKFAGS